MKHFIFILILLFNIVECLSQDLLYMNGSDCYFCLQDTSSYKEGNNIHFPRLLLRRSFDKNYQMSLYYQGSLVYADEGIYNPDSVRTIFELFNDDFLIVTPMSNQNISFATPYQIIRDNCIILDYKNPEDILRIKLDNILLVPLGKYISEYKEYEERIDGIRYPIFAIKEVDLNKNILKLINSQGKVKEVPIIELPNPIFD